MLSLQLAIDEARELVTGLISQKNHRQCLEVPLQTDIKVHWRVFHQSRLLPRVLLQSKGSDQLELGMGASDILPLDGCIAKDLRLKHKLTDPEMTYYGCSRFDSGNESGIATEWQPFGHQYWFLPRIVLKNESLRVYVLNSAFESEQRQALEALAEMREALVKELPPLQDFRKYQGLSEIFSRQAYLQAASDLIQEFDHEFIKVVLARCKRFGFKNPNPWDLLRLRHPELGQRLTTFNHYLFALQVPSGESFVSVTPEQLCSVQANLFQTEALAGTWPLGILGDSRIPRDPTVENSQNEDIENLRQKLNVVQQVKSELESDGTDYDKLRSLTMEELDLTTQILCSDEKNALEHSIVVRHLDESLKNADLDFHILPKELCFLKDIVHARQKVEGYSRTLEGLDLVQKLVLFVHPTPAICGYPMGQAVQRIRQKEPFDRGMYAGYCGSLSSNQANLMVGLRSALLTAEHMYFYAGSGLVKESEPLKECEELDLKFRTFTQHFQWEAAKIPAAPTARLATLMVAEFHRSGCLFVICPGSRNSPLVSGILREGADYLVCQDERSAGFLALGAGHHRPVVLVVTSGSAVANLLPAFCEAANARRGLIVISADRPAHLLSRGGNQTLGSQNRLLDPCVGFSKNWVAHSEFCPIGLLADLDYTLFLSGCGVSAHFNLELDEPLVFAEDDEAVKVPPGDFQDWHQCQDPFNSYFDLHGFPGQSFIHHLWISQHPILLVVGTMTCPIELESLMNLCRRLRIPVLSDITAHLRAAQEKTVLNHSHLIFGSSLFDHREFEGTLLRVGGPLVSKVLEGLAHKVRGPIYRICSKEDLLQAQERREAGRRTNFVLASLCELDQAVASQEAQFSRTFETLRNKRQADVDFLHGCDAKVGDLIDMRFVPSNNSALTELGVAYWVSHIPGHCYLGNSMPIRDMDLVSHTFKQTRVANRGTSGIEGVLSSAVGYFSHPIFNKPGYLSQNRNLLILGDMSAQYDFMSLKLAKNLTVVIVQNYGGRIFSFLPVAQDEGTTQVIEAPHTQSFESMSRAVGAQYWKCRTEEELNVALQTSTGLTVIEAIVHLTPQENVKDHRELQAQVSQLLCEKAAQVLDIKIETFGMDNLVVFPGFLGPPQEICSALDLHGHCLDLFPDQIWSSRGLLPFMCYSMGPLIHKIRELVAPFLDQETVFLGYSMGARLLCEFLKKSALNNAAIFLSGFGGTDSKLRRDQDFHLGKQLETQALREFLTNHWFTKALWGPDFPHKAKQLIDQRVNLLLDKHLSIQLNLSAGIPSTHIHELPNRKLYIYGSLDSKYGDYAKSLEPLQRFEVPETYHLVYFGDSTIVKEAIQTFRLVQLEVHPFRLPFVHPLKLHSFGRATTLSHREGLHLRVFFDSIRLIAECSPLPIFSEETMEMARVQLDFGFMSSLLKAFQGGSVDLSNYWPSVRFAWESLRNHWKFCHRRDIQGVPSVPLCLSSNPEKTCKLKGDAQTGFADLAALCAAQGKRGEQIRLDFNGALSLPEALAGFKYFDCGLEFIEEPLSNFKQIAQLKQALPHLKFGLDENVPEFLEHLEQWSPDLVAAIQFLVIKPSCRPHLEIAKKHHFQVILSSSHETPVGLAHLSLMAQEFPGHAHGLGTADYLGLNWPMKDPVGILNKYAANFSSLNAGGFEELDASDLSDFEILSSLDVSRLSN